MDLTNMFKEGSLSKTDWLDKVETFNPSNMGLTNKEQMEIQWDKEVEPEVKEKMIKRRINKLLNEGYFGAEVLESVKKSNIGIKISTDIAKYLKARSGIIGTIIVDCSLIKDSNDYVKLRKASSFKNFHQYTINCSCDHKNKNKKAEVIDNGNFDGLMNSKVKKEANVCFCKKTGLEKK